MSSPSPPSSSSSPASSLLHHISSSHRARAKDDCIGGGCHGKHEGVGARHLGKIVDGDDDYDDDFGHDDDDYNDDDDYDDYLGKNLVTMTIIDSSINIYILISECCF